MPINRKCKLSRKKLGKMRGGSLIPTNEQNEAKQLEEAIALSKA